MKISQMTAADYNGKVFQALSRIESIESEVDVGMKFSVQAINPMGYDDVYRVILDGSQFVEHNDGKMQANYWTPDGSPSLTARQANMWPENNIIDIYLMGDDNWEEWFAVL